MLELPLRIRISAASVVAVAFAVHLMWVVEYFSLRTMPDVSFWGLAVSALTVLTLLFTKVERYFSFVMGVGGFISVSLLFAVQDLLGA